MSIQNYSKLLPKCCFFNLNSLENFFKGGRRSLPPKMMIFLLIGVVQKFSHQVLWWLKIEIESLSEDQLPCMNKILDTVRPEGFTDFWLSSRRPISLYLLRQYASGCKRLVLFEVLPLLWQLWILVDLFMQTAIWKLVKTFQSFYFNLNLTKV